MQTISITKTLKWQVKFAPQYKFSADKKLYNCRTGREIKKTVNGGQVGYWICGNWWSLLNLRSQIEKIKKEPCPF